jgi:16S rRNA (guanine527-N7)-methyltransferase
MPVPTQAPDWTRVRLHASAVSLGIELAPSALDELVTFLDELERWNARANLVGEHARETLLDRHVVDALAAAPLLRSLGDGLRIADLGSGAGLPGIPLAIALRPREMMLVEPRRKRASFLRAVRRRLVGVPLSVLEQRAEDLAGRDRGSFDAVVSRAALTDAELHAAASFLLRPAGLVIAYRGTARTATQPARMPAPQENVPGLGLAKVHPYALPGLPREFALVVRERTRST